MAAVKPNSAKTKPSTKNEKLGLYCEFLNHALHGDGCSTCPPNYSVHSGLNDIVVTAWSGQQIIVNNLNNNYDDNVVIKSKHIISLITIKSSYIEGRDLYGIVKPYIRLNHGILISKITMEDQ